MTTTKKYMNNTNKLKTKSLGSQLAQWRWNNSTKEQKKKQNEIMLKGLKAKIALRNKGKKSY